MTWSPVPCTRPLHNNVRVQFKLLSHERSEYMIQLIESPRLHIPSMVVGWSGARMGSQTRPEVCQACPELGSVLTCGQPPYTRCLQRWPRHLQSSSMTCEECSCMCATNNPEFEVGGSKTRHDIFMVVQQNSSFSIVCFSLRCMLDQAYTSGGGLLVFFFFFFFSP